jgi:hypothetical protein
MLIYKDGIVAHYKEIFSNTSFSASGPSDEFLAEQGAVKVNVFKDHDRATQKLVPAEPYIEDGWCYTVTVTDKTEEEIAADTAARAARVRAQRDRLLAASDWTQVADAPVDQAAWATYRQALRDLPDAEGFPDVEMPRDPDYVEPVAGNID